MINDNLHYIIFKYGDEIRMLIKLIHVLVGMKAIELMSRALRKRG